MVLIAAACGSTDSEPGNESPTGSATSSPISTDSTIAETTSTDPATSDAATTDACLNEDGYPCLRSDVDPAVLEREGEYAERVAQLLDSGSRPEALAWIEAQDQVVETYLDETTLRFRVDGGMPMVFVDPLEDPSAEASSQTQAVGATLALNRGGPADLAGTPIGQGSSFALGGSGVVGDVVGAGTSRDNPQNRKKALILTPFEDQGWSMFDVAGPDPEDILRSIPDYAHNPDDVLHVSSEFVTPHAFGWWNDYDAIFVETHGGAWSAGLWIGSGVKARLDPGPGITFTSTCTALMAPYTSITGLSCGWVSHRGDRYVVLGMLPRFFRDTYGASGGLDKAIVYIGGCSTADTAVADSIAGTTSAYLGWTDSVFIHKEENVAASLLWLLAREGTGGRMTVENALFTLRDNNLIGGEGWGNNATPFLRLRNNGDVSPKLRLYDLPTLRDPKNPVSVGPGLQDGAELKTEGAPGDGQNDKVEIAVDVIGVIDPEDRSNTFTNVALRQSESPAHLYDQRFYLDDEEIGRDNLGRNFNPTAVVTEFADTSYRYVFTADLPFDVDPDGTDATLKVVVSLPEGGESSYEVDVVLLGGEAGAVITIGGETWEFELVSFFGDVCQLPADDDDSFIITSGYVDGDFEATSFSAHIEPDGEDVEGLFSVHGITVQDPETRREFMADDLQYPSLYWLAAIPEGGSQIDEVTIEGGHAWGTATFIDVEAMHQAWLNNGPLPAPVTGSFDIRCD